MNAFGREHCPIKWAVSLKDKSTLPNTADKALILLGDVGSEENPLEYEELLNYDFAASQIIGFEKDNHKYQLAKIFYKNDNSTIYKDLEKNIKKIELHSVGYMHLDFMASITQHIFAISNHISNLLSDNSRVRITAKNNWALGGPFGNYQLSIVRNIAYDIFLPLCALDSINPHKYIQIQKEIEKYFIKPDSNYTLAKKGEISGKHGHIGVAMFIFSSLIMRSGKDLYLKENIDKAKKWVQNPPLNHVRFNIKNIKKIEYIEYGKKSSMITSWFDIENKKVDRYILLNQICNYILQPSDEICL